MECVKCFEEYTEVTERNPMHGGCDDAPGFSICAYSGFVIQRKVFAVSEVLRKYNIQHSREQNG
jgi:hypothetical protein